MGSFFFRHFGCRLNHYEGSSIISELYERGWKRAARRSESQIALVHACTVTARADYKVRSEIKKIEMENPDAKIYVLGCYDSSLRKKFPNAVFIPNQKKSRTCQIIKKDFPDSVIPQAREDSHEDPRFSFFLPSNAGYSRAYLKIQDGCDEKCAYCKIPQVRGKSISRNPEAVENEVRKLIESGFHEIILTGVNIGDYRKEGINFYGLLERISHIPGEFYFRISSLEPMCIDPRIIPILKNPKFAGFLHIPIQSGSPQILRAMNRSQDMDALSRNIENIQNHFPDIFLGTDIMVGFPGETHTDFEHTMNFLHRHDFSRIHAFPFSLRERTPLERSLRNQNKNRHSPEEKMEYKLSSGNEVGSRMEQVMALDQFLRDAYRKKTSHRVYRAIVEIKNQSLPGEEWTAVTENYQELFIPEPMRSGLQKKGMIHLVYDISGILRLDKKTV